MTHGEKLLTHLRAQLESNKIFNVIINPFTLLNCRPEILKKVRKYYYTKIKISTLKH